MRVNVTYSVELDEIKQLVGELLLKVEDDIGEDNRLFPEIQDHVQAGNEKKAVELIEKCRNNLLAIDHSLFDSKNILNGYQQTLLQVKSGTSEGSNVEGG